MILGIDTCVDLRFCGHVLVHLVSHKSGEK